jgi:hypothetical protein
VRPAKRKLDFAALGKLWVGGIAIDLQDALEAAKMDQQSLGLAIRL